MSVRLFIRLSAAISIATELAFSVRAQTNAMPPVLTNLPAVGVQSTAATMEGQIISEGGDVPAVAIFYGTTDGGTNAGAWQNAVSVGNQIGGFALTVPGLSPGTTYFYTAVASNSAGGAWAAPSQSFTTPALNPSVPVAVLTYHNDNTRDGANTNETALTLGNVNVASFGCLFSYPVDGYVYAQPLIMTNVTIPGNGVHDVIYVVTEHDTAYALDADSSQGANGGVLWRNHVGTSSPMPNNDFGNRYGPYHDLVPEVGITGTPVIDPVAGTIYFDAFTLDGTNGSGAHVYNHRIHALDITTGNERPYSPVLVAATFPGRGIDSSNGIVTFTPTQQAQRPAFTLAGGTLYIAYSSFADSNPFHGWLMSFTTNLQLLSVFNTTPNATVANFGTNAGEGSIWMGGDGVSVDANTNLYFETGNGSFSANTNGGDYGDSFMKLSTTNGLKVVDYFTPNNQANFQANDLDLGSGGSILLPDNVGSATYPHLLIGSGKIPIIYLVNRDNLGHYTNFGLDRVVQEVSTAISSDFTTPAYFNHLIYYVGVSDVLKALAITNAAITATPFSRAATTNGFPGATPAISANGTANAIAWAIQTDAYNSQGPAILHAYNATNLSQELYNSSQNLSRDNPGGAVKFSVPTVAGGKVYVGAEYKLSVFGGAVFLTAPEIQPNGGTFTNSVSVTLAGAPPGVSLYYTLDGTAPTTNSAVYTGPFTLTNNAQIHAIATAPGAVNSATTTASFIVVPEIYFTSEQFLTNGQFQLGLFGAAGSSYILEGSTDLINWVPINTNLALTNTFDLFDSAASNYPYRFYRVLQQ